MLSASPQPVLNARTALIAAWTAVNRIARRTAMMAITTSNSINEKPGRRSAFVRGGLAIDRAGASGIEGQTQASHIASKSEDDAHAKAQSTQRRKALGDSIS